MNIIKLRCILSVVIVSTIAIFLLFLSSCTRVNLKNTSEIILKYNYLDINVVKNIINESEIQEIENLFKNNKINYDDLCWCFYDKNISITFINKNNTITLYPALDGYNGFKTEGGSDLIIISEEKNKKLIAVLEKYNFIIPLFSGH